MFSGWLRAHIPVSSKLSIYRVPCWTKFNGGASHVALRREIQVTHGNYGTTLIEHRKTIRVKDDRTERLGAFLFS